MNKKILAAITVGLICVSATGCETSYQEAISANTANGTTRSNGYFTGDLMKEIRSFLCDKRPDLFDYIASRDIAQKDNCVICLQWIVPYSGTYSEIIYGNESDDDLEAMDKKYYVYPM